MTNLAARVQRIPRDCVWEITEACNLRCLHCMVSAGERAAGELNTAEALSLADDLAAAGCISACLTGGEPLVRKDWPQIARRLAQGGVETRMTTNGLRVDEQQIELMQEAGLTTITVSLDGLREVHDEIRVAPSGSAESRYDRAIRAIELLLVSPLKVKVLTQIHKRNIDDLDRMHELVAGLGVDDWQLQIAVPAGRLLDLRYEYLIEPRQIPALLDRLAAFVAAGRVRIGVADNIGYYSRQEPILRGAQRGKPTFFAGCMAGVRMVSVTASGDVRGCHALPREFIAGNVREKPFAEIWADRAGFAYNTDWREYQLTGGCATCDFRRVCRAGCTAMAYLVTGTVHDNPYCVQRV